MQNNEIEALSKYRLEQAKELGRRINEASFFREKSDYVDFYIVTKQESQMQIETARLIIKEASEYIMKRLGETI